MNEGKEFMMPVFDFKKQSRSSYVPFKREADSLVIIEGIHALNPLVTGENNFATCIYISVRTRLKDRNNKILHPRIIRLIRRLCRDSLFRGRNLESIFSYFESVSEGEDKYIFPNSSLDVYQNPKSKREEIHISYPTYDKYVSREFYSREKAMKDREVTSTKCPLCHNPAKRKIRWFMNNSKVYYSVSLCQEHGFVLGKIRIRRTEDNKYYVIKKLTNVTDEEADEIRQKRDAHRAKRRLKKEEQ